ncbi:MAG: FAD-dependent oxidoreductase [Anaerolineae bacterium]|nr:FAD-dependent oxidoreductase [Anaerolineae bacterium]
MTEIQDLVVIGGGSGGFAAAMRAAQLGGRVTLVEADLYGGNCMNRACIPTTFLMTAARRMQSVRQAGLFGIRAGEPEVDLQALHERKDLLIEGLRLGTEQLLTEYGVTLLRGQGRLVARDVVEVDGQRIPARNIVIATGSVAAQLPVEGADLPGVMGTEEAVALREVPARLAVIGSQPWDLELAQYFHTLGSQVTIIEPGPQLLPEADREISQRLSKHLYDSGIAIRRGIGIEAIRQREDGALAVLLANGQEVLADRVLAARRLPNSIGLGLREQGVRTEGGAIVVNDRMETSIPHIYAVGDVVAGPMWSHKANVEGIVAAENAMGRASRMDYTALPRCVYTWPEVAWVGLMEEEALARGLEVMVGKFPIAINPYAMILEEGAGMVKVITGQYGKILGVHMMAPGAMDLINTAAMAILAEATLQELLRLIPAHPSIGEALVDAAMDVEKRSLHLPKWE